MIKKALFAVFAALSPVLFVHAKPWNQDSIDQLSDQALTAVNQFIANDPQSALNKHLRDSEIIQLRAYIKSGNLSFLGIVDRLMPSIKRQSNSVALPYFALRHSLLNSPQSGLNLYEALLREDDDAARYAFAQLNQLPLSGNPKWLKKRQQLHDYYGFSTQPTDISDEQVFPEVCLRFSQRVRPKPAQDWEQLIQITPAPRIPLNYRGNKLCFSGLWQTRYQIDIDKRLQSFNQLTLQKNITETVSTGVRPAMIRFASDGFVLDANSERKLAISTANIDNVSVALWQLSASNLGSQRIQSLIRSPQRTSEWRLGDILRRNGDKLFSGTFNVGDYQTNETVTTNVFFDDLKTDKPPTAGIYVLTAGNADTTRETAQIAFSLTNAGLSAYLTDEGLWVEMRDLQTGEPVTGQPITLHAVDNRILGQQSTNSSGVASFPKSMVTGKNGLRPSHVIAENNAYFAYLDIEENPVDLSDKGLSGQLDNAPLRSWVWSDRGIYRPNDNAHVMWLLKTPEGKPFNSAPIWLELLRPDATVMHDEMVKADASGAYTFDHYFDNASRQGDWKIRLSLGKDGAFIAEKTLPVSSIAPQQIETTIQTIEKDIGAKETVSIDVQADWLYGAPATDLATYLNQTIIERKIDDKRWAGWQIGLHDEKRFYEAESFATQSTDKKGKVRFAANTDDITFTTKPLSLHLTAHVTEPSGQVVQATYDKAISRQQPYVTLKSTGKKQISAALIDDNNAPVTGMGHWQLFRVNYDYYWYKQGGQWQYQHNESRELVTSGEINFDGKAPAVLDLPLDDGAWVVVVRGEDAATAASIPLEFGQYVSASKGNAPDRIQVKTDKSRYVDGETVTVHLTAPFDGKASVKFAHNDRLLDDAVGHHLVNFVDGKATLSFTWKKSWDNGLWLLANGWNKQQKNIHNRRAIGLHWLGGDLSPYQLDVTATLPEIIEPNQQLTIPLHIPKGQISSKTWAQVAVIDEGLYQLTKPSFSNPLQAFWDKKQLNLSFFDVWGDIIRQIDARQAALRSGAGGELGSDSALKALPERDVQLVTYWSAPVAFDADGNASLTVDIPQFNGRLRVMVAAWNDEKLGGYDNTLQVRAPLVANLYTPVYLSPGDASSIRVRLHNTTDKTMTLTPHLDTKGFVLSSGNEEALTLAPDEKKWVQQTFEIPSDEQHRRAEVSVSFTGDNEHVQLSRFMDIRPKTTVKQTQHIDSLPGNGQKTFEASTDEGFWQRNVFVSTTAPYNITAVLKDLSTYPYGCNEQITSKAWNNLFVKGLLSHHIDGNDWGTDASRERDVFAAQNQLANRQARDGAFSLWGDGYEDVWLSAYITDFLLDAKNAQQLSNPQSLSRALRYLRNIVMRHDDRVDAIAYAHAVLAKAGEPVQGATMRFAENLLHAAEKPRLSTSTLQTVSALVQHGEMVLAKQLLMTIADQGYQPKSYQSTKNYGSPLRNLAQSLYTAYQLQAQLQRQQVDEAMQTNLQTVIQALWQPMREALATSQYFSTQELHWLAALATQLPSKKQASVTINGQPMTINGSRRFQLKKNEAMTLKNNSDSPIFVTQNDWIFPKTEETVANGYRVSMRYEDVDGNRIDLSQLTHNQQVVAIATIEVDDSQKNSHLMFAYPLPAGLSVEPFDAHNYDNEARSWYKHLGRAVFSENRDDRHLAAFNLSSANTFTHVFMLRASQVGTWHAPAYSVENMYQPQFRAVQAMPVVVVEK